MRWNMTAPMNQKAKNTSRPVTKLVTLARLSLIHSSSRNLTNSSCNVKVRFNGGGLAEFTGAFFL